ncbi:isovaleryl-CoA dehydrogenase [Azohydromonas caseinilytica]|uniref:Isovaleryl-CoA dehydrogenase n=1 Tax=Azohydromonas caseinilytica TaxID=2728836 RepID=A0A848F330_9BURK|nr:isovaleryl-CoA dehydrogenase [Azohydromonas caseinilytica]NML14467.1 isovaleryl-CoA dehydrogenase [Azohydromonas caseinilytica]
MTTHATHEVFNQSSELTGVDLFAGHRPLQEALRTLAPDLDLAPLHALGRALGSAELQAQARLANRYPPRLRPYDRGGRRIDEVEFHPAYHALMQCAATHGLQAAPWARPPGAHIARAAGFLLFNGVEAGVMCPISMSYAATPALRANAALYAAWGPGLSAPAYDPRPLPGPQKAGLTMGMGMTEKQGGSDLRAITSRAEFDQDTDWGRCFRLTGHKWFFSAPMSDAHLVLARTAAGPSGFFVPRLLPDGSRNALQIQRLKDKLGNHANASAEVEFDGALGWLVGEEGRGIAQILEMGTLTRLDCALGSAGLMRQALALALHHCTQRSAFGRPLIEQPLMRSVLADLALEVEGATALAMRLACAVDVSEHPGGGAAREALLRRLLTPIAKFWVCKRGSHFAQEAMECLGGNGYVEDEGHGPMARLYREMPLNSIWEGAGNVMALDLLRALRGEAVIEVLQQELAVLHGAHPGAERLAATLSYRLAVPEEAQARRLARDVALLLQAALLRRQAPEGVFAAFCAARIDAGADLFGALPPGCDVDLLLERAMP